MTKKNKIIIAAVSGVVLISVVATVLFTTINKPPVTPPPEEKPTVSDVTMPTPKEDETPVISTPEEVKEEEIKVDVDDGKSSASSKTPAKDSEKPVKPTLPVTSPKDDKNETDIGGNPPQSNDYSCGVAKHKCINAENHANIANLELQGCSYCSSKKCPSFYFVSAAGIPICNPTLCPKYDSGKDPIKTCQDCKKPMGDGANGTCEKFLTAGKCSTCGADVKAHTCHSH